MCECCMTAHVNFKGFKSHKVFAINEFKERQSSLAQAACTIHNKPLELYCTDCHAVVCLTCTVVAHRNHEIKSIADAAVGKLHSNYNYIDDSNNYMEVRASVVI